ncbi:MAG TPA: DUF58 domain-containing protein [Ilumatobacteraceae bacterium]|jgi:uncharacterized protein (DUF58 family)|nr:DUF58 domain-containing protein [Ilumatobacteraceae bacterium]HQY13270.1 DUF58 domain-containing protein [Ilumatobacteraceae bacterium]HQY83931.1 DUF58 domain-containing protein [Ilumatobacteraceae bacterium]HRA83364.1 DUF58 domain-containing protein [Ilumatobacteraceae bacterium]HRC46921.1 DUF58 domain-containing protein [Ilumatobacteraceae bacterium]
MQHRLAYPVPTIWFAALVAASGLALFAWPGRSWVALGVVEVLLVLVFVADAVLCVAPRRIDVQREIDESVTLGEETTLTWLVANRAARLARVTVTDALWPSLQAERRRVSATLRAGARLRAKSVLRPSRRGRFPLRDVTVRVEGPLRLVSRQATRAVEGGVRVMPAYPSREDVQRRIRTPRVLEVGLRSIRTSGGGTEFDQLRDYRPDDEFRRIDWPSTVRLQRTIVKQYRAERNQNIVLLLDNGRVMAGTVGGVPRVEHAMDAALGVVQAATKLGDRVGMLAFDRQVRSILVPTNGKSQLGRAAEAMYMLEPDYSESAYQVAFNDATARFRRRSLFIVLTDLVEAVVEQALLPALPTITRRHLVVVAAVQDPAVTAWAAGGAHRWASEAYREAAAVNVLHERARAIARLRAAGAMVVDAAPGQLATELVDKYLEVKASGRL